jgi:hypothetical protein
VGNNVTRCQTLSWLYQPENVEYCPEPKWLEAARFEAQPYGLTDFTEVGTL